MKFECNSIYFDDVTIKDSYSRVNESKQQLNSFIIYDLDSIARVNERKKKKKKVKLTKKRKVELPGLELTAGEVFRSCQSWTLYHCATKLRQFLLLKFFIKNVSTGKTVVYTIVTVFFTLVLLLSFSLSQHCCDIRYFILL